MNKLDQLPTIVLPKKIPDVRTSESPTSTLEVATISSPKSHHHHLLDQQTNFTLPYIESANAIYTATTKSMMVEHFETKKLPDPPNVLLGDLNQYSAPQKEKESQDGKRKRQRTTKASLLTAKDSLLTAKDSLLTDFCSQDYVAQSGLKKSLLDDMHEGKNITLTQEEAKSIIINRNLLKIISQYSQIFDVNKVYDGNHKLNPKK